MCPVVLRVKNRREDPIRATDATRYSRLDGVCNRISSHIFNPWRTASHPSFSYMYYQHQWCCWHTRGILPFVFPVILYDVLQWNYITVASLQFHISLIRTRMYVPTNWRFPVSTGTLGTCASSSTYETIYVESFPTTGHFFPRTRSHYPLNDCSPNFFVQSPSLRHRTPPPISSKVPPYSLMTLPSSL